MAAPSFPSPAKLDAGRPRPRWTSLFSRAARLAVMLVIAAAGLLLLQSYRTLLHDAPAAPEKNASRTAETVFEPGRDLPVEQLSESLLQPGAWSLGDSDWSLATLDLSVADAEARLQSLGRAATAETKPSTLEEKVLAWLRQFRPAIVDGCRVYDTRLGATRVRVVTEIRGRHERMRLAQLVSQQHSSARLLEAWPAAVSDGREKGERHLLPLPAGVVSLARRWDGAGRLSCELLGPASAEDCLRGWSSAGWTSAKVAAVEGPFSITTLRSGGQRVQLCTFQTGPAGSPAYLLLMADPAEQ